MQQDAIIQPGMRIQDVTGLDLGVVESAVPSANGRATEVTLAQGGGMLLLDPAIVDDVDGDTVRLSARAEEVQNLSSTDGRGAGTGYVQTTQTTSAATAVTDDSVHIQRYEERLVADTVERQAGAVRIEKHVVEVPESFAMDVTREEFDVQRVAVSRDWQPGDEAPRQEGDTLVVPIVEEKLYVARRKVVTGEVRLTKRVVTERRQVTETVRKEVVDVTSAGDVEADATRRGRT